MTQPDDKERFVCFSCLTVGPLNERLRCSSCDGDSVISAEVLRQTTSAPKPVSAFTPTPQKWFRIQCGLFETVVSYTKALTQEQALAYAETSLCEWYRNQDVSGETFRGASFDVRELKHDEFNQWCQKMWPVNT